jgi:hypothetical protein
MSFKIPMSTQLQKTTKLKIFQLFALILLNTKKVMYLFQLKCFVEKD